MQGFQKRHIGIEEKDLSVMLESIGVKSVDELIDQTVPAGIRLSKALQIEGPLTEQQWLKWINEVGSENKLLTNFIGQGYYGTYTPSVILRNIFENPGWYTAYTPYQAEIAQGRLEALLNFQTLVMELTGMEIANASLLDEATATAEAMIMLFGSRSRKDIKAGKNVFLIDDAVFLQTQRVLETRAKYLGIEIIKASELQANVNDKVFGAIVQYPNRFGEVKEYKALAEALHAVDASLVVAADLMSLVLLKDPSSFGADVVVGNTQRFGVPMGYGGPHAAFFATHEKFKRNVPGRIIGVSKDTKGRNALRMALQTREQHIRREKATSNICTAQALLAIMAGMYAVYHGSEGLKKIAQEIHEKASGLRKTLAEKGIKVLSSPIFDTVTIESSKASKITDSLLKKGINVWKHDDNRLSISIDETTQVSEIEILVSTLEGDDAKNDKLESISTFARSEAILQQDVFNRYHSESAMMRYIKQLENKDLSLVHGMISLGSCTMKLNAASEMMPLSNPQFNALHPYVPVDQAKGYQKVLSELKRDLLEITGFDGLSFQPNSGAQGELAGLLTIKRYFEAKGENHRNVVLIPSSAHGTNPASAVMAGMDVVVVKCDDQGNIDVADLKNKAEVHKNDLAALMVTYPSTHGVFETGIREVTKIIHDNGGQVYMDGANMNAQVGLTSPAEIGADVCHLNLHKTFAIPHGGGGPGMGPIGVRAHLTPHLPSEDVFNLDKDTLGVLSAAPYSSALILIISLGYIKMLGAEGVTNATKYAILNANYLKSKLEDDFKILYTGEHGRVAHEMIIDCRDYKQNLGLEVMDIAKRLIDYGFHAPTVSFPVPGTMMIEPTESEDLVELDRFIEAMKSIAQEVDEVRKGIYPKDNNVLVNSPHPAADLLTTEWDYPYTREKAAYPVSTLYQQKFWAPVSRIDNAYGDRNLICSCNPISDYEEVNV
jgi:glycine dehydrogenase